MIKSDRWIRNFGVSGGIIPFDLENVNPASYDVTLGNHWLIPANDKEKYYEVNKDEIILAPKDVLLATTAEYIKMPRDVCCDLKLKSTIGRSFVDHAMAGFVDCGFEGNITLELHNIGPNSFRLYSGLKIAQLVFFQMEEEPSFVYGEKGRGKYQNQIGTTPARLK